MGGESSSASIDSGVDMPIGTETELLRIGGAQLCLLDGEESVRLGAGQFALIMMVQSQTPLAALVAQVADVQWPVGKDGPVLKLANCRYTFAIPGLLYGLLLPKDTPKELIQKFESYMMHYCTYEVRPDIAKAAGLSNLGLRYPPSPNPNDATTDGVQFWSAVAEDVEQYSNKLAQSIKKGSTIAASGISKGGEWASWGINQGGSMMKSKFMRTSSAGERGGDGDEMSPRMRYRVDQARRMSAIAKLLSKTVLRGAISATGHVANTLGTAIGNTPPVRAFLNSEARREVAVASVDAFAKVAEAVETAGKSLTTATASVGADLVHHRYGDQMAQVAQEGFVTVADMVNSMWTLNKFGLRMLWTATTSSIVMNASRNNSNPSSRSPTSSDTSSQTRMQSSILSRQASNSRNMMLSSPSDEAGTPSPTTPQNEPVLETAQLFPSTSGLDHPHSTNSYSTASPNHLYMHHHHQQSIPMVPVYSAYYHPAPQNPSSPFQHYTRPGGPPQVQPFFPYSGVDRPSANR